VRKKQKPTCFIIAGPNGAGKTTFALRYLPQIAGCHNFVNADLIAYGLSPFGSLSAQYEAGRIFLREIHANIDKRVDFAFETTLAGRSQINLLKNSGKTAGRSCCFSYGYLTQTFQKGEFVNGLNMGDIIFLMIQFTDVFLVQCTISLTFIFLYVTKSFVMIIPNRNLFLFLYKTKTGRKSQIMIYTKVS
jgi:hypothetical protein